MCLCFYPSIYLSWWCSGESSVSGSRVGNVLQMLPVRREETIPRRFQSPPKPAPPWLPPSFHLAISRGANELMRGGGRERERERRGKIVQMRWSSHALCVCVFGFGPSITQVRECSMLDLVIRCHRDVTRGDCVETRGLADRTGLGSSSSTTPGLFQLVLILGCFCTDAAPLHTCAWCQACSKKGGFQAPST